MKKELSFLLVCNYINMFGYGLFGPIYALFVLSIDGSGNNAGLAWGLYGMIAGLLMMYFGYYEDRHDKKKMIPLGFFILFCGALAYAFVSSVTHLYIAQVINALGVGILTPAFKAMYAKDEDLGKESEEWAFLDGGNMVLLAIAAMIGGYFVTHFSFVLLFYVMSAIQFLAFLISLKILNKKITQS